MKILFVMCALLMCSCFSTEHDFLVKIHSWKDCVSKRCDLECKVEEMFGGRLVKYDSYAGVVKCKCYVNSGDLFRYHKITDMFCGEFPVK